MQVTNLRGRDGASATTEDSDIFPSCSIEQLSNIGEIFHVAALIGCEGNRMCVLFDSRLHHIECASIMTEMNHFTTCSLNQTPHDIDGRIVTIEQ